MISKLILTRPKKTNIISSLIMLVEKTNFSHCGWLHETVVYESIAHGCVATDSEQFLKKNKIVLSISIKDMFKDITAAEINKALRYANDNLGTRYGFLTLFFGIPLNKLFGTTFFSDGAKSMICSEFFCRIFEKRFRRIFNKPLDMVTPMELGKKFKLIKKSIIRLIEGKTCRGVHKANGLYRLND